jgi:hypothetical protein
MTARIRRTLLYSMVLALILTALAGLTGCVVVIHLGERDFHFGPTQVPQPTYTPAPTLTAMPTYTTMPTFTPLPTYTLLPVFSPTGTETP